MLKKLLSTVFLTATLLLSSFAFADETVTNDIVYSANVLGLLPVVSSQTRTLIAVPWCDMSETNDLPISAADIVKTANLTTGDKLYAYRNDTRAFDCWVLTEGSDKILYWQSVNQVSETGTVMETESSAAYPIARGNSLMLIRQHPTKNDAALPFYLYGQVGTNTSVISTITPGSAVTPAYSLISCPATSTWKVNDENVIWSGINSGDTIQVNWDGGRNDILSRGVVDSKTVWGKYVETTKTRYGKTVTSYSFQKYDEDIPAGIGVWYVSYGSGTTVMWKNVAVK